MKKHVDSILQHNFPLTGLLLKKEEKEENYRAIVEKNTLAIQESEQRYRAFVQQSTEGIWRIELEEAMSIDTPVDEMIEYCYFNSYIAECNDTFARMYGYESAETIIGCPLSKLLPADDPNNMAYIYKFFSNNFKVVDELSYELDKDGRQMTFMNNMIGIVENGFIKRAWGTQRNITQLKTTESELIQRENHLKAIVNADPECIKLLSREGAILEMNPAGLQMLCAADLAQVVGKKGVDLVLPEYKELFLRSIEEVFKGNSWKLEFEILDFEGQKHSMESNCVPLKNGEGEINEMLCVTRDVTERNIAQDRLKASEERYRYLFNNNPSCIFIWDIDTLEILEANETAETLYGYSKEEFLQLSFPQLCGEGEADGFVAFTNSAGEVCINKETRSTRHITKTGNHIIMEIASHLIMYEGKQAVLALGNDITEKYQLETSLNEERKLRQQQITEAVITGQEKERTELGEELHDNINQILASTKLYIECALKDQLPRKDLIAESKVLVEKAMTEIRNLSKSLLPPSLGEVGLMQALHEMVENIKQVNNLNITLHSHISDENHICTKLKLTIFRIVQEQLNNIIKHADAENVSISIDMIDKEIELLIKDDGLGFNTSLKRNGVGLRNISSRAEVNNGKVSIKSNPGEGCELLVKFPENPDTEKTIINI